MSQLISEKFFSSMKVTLTKEAARQINKAYMDAPNESVASILWVCPNYEENYSGNEKEKSVSFSKVSNGYWDIALYDRSEVPEHFIRNNQGVDFVFEMRKSGAYELNAIIDYKNGQISVSYVE